MKQIISLTLALVVASVLIGCSEKKPKKHQESEADCLKIEDVSSKTACLMNLAKSKYDAGATESSIKLLSSAMLSCEGIESAEERLENYNKAAKLLGSMGDRYRQDKAIEKASEAIEQLTDPDKKAKGLIEIADTQLANGNLVDASANATKACDMIQDNFLPDDKASILLIAARVYQENGEHNKLEEALNKVQKLADSLKNDSQKMIELYGQIAVAQFKMNQKDVAAATFDKAMEIAKGAKELDARGFGLVYIVNLALGIDQKDIAKKFLAEAKKTVVPLSKVKSDRGAELESECSKLEEKLK